MTKLLSLLALLILAVGVGRTAAPPPAAVATFHSVPLLYLHEVSQPCAPGMILAPCTTPEKRPGVFIGRVTVRVPSMETVYVPRTHQVKQLRQVYRPVPCTVMLDVFVPVVTRVKKVRMVYRQHEKEQVRPRLVYVPTTRQEQHLRMVYRPIERREPWTRDVYVPMVTREKHMRLVYLTEPVRITKTVPRIRLEDVAVRDPGTGKMQTIQKPICDQVQVTETVRRVTACVRPVEETVTNYRLERRTDMRTVIDHVLQCQLVSTNVTRYHLATRLVRERVRCYVLQPEVVEETVTNYRLERRPVTRRTYVCEWREVLENVTTYHLETRRVMRTVEQFITCPGEIVVPITRMHPLPWSSPRKVVVAEPLMAPCAGVAPGYGTGISGGFVSPFAADVPADGR